MLKQYDSALRYIADTKKITGSHYTPSQLAAFVAQELLRLPYSSTQIRILDPAIGDGELILAVLNQLRGNSLSIQVIGFDIDSHALEQAEKRITSQFQDVSTDFRHVDFLDFATQFHKPDLFNQFEFLPVDIVISNPPYVRTQVIGSEKSQELAQTFNLSGRVDLSFAFIKAIGWVLKPNGVAGIIVSNRFMTTKAGAKVRDSLQQDFNIHHIWDLGDTKLFDAAVLPAVLLVEKRNGCTETFPPRFSKIYTTQRPKTYEQKFTTVIDALPLTGVVETVDSRRFQIQHGHLAESLSSDDVWRISTDESKQWLDKVASHTHCCFGDIGKIRVGVKTTADKIFIRDDWHMIEQNECPELLRPVTTHHIGQRFRSIEPSQPRKILYTHEYHNGKRRAIELADYPKSARYLEANRAKLEARSYIKKSNRNWYEIWVPQDPRKWPSPKLVFRDIVEKPTFWIDFSGAVVNGDCYWMALDSEVRQETLWLALAIANSTFIESFYDYRFNNKLYAGRRRYITQYVQKFPLPDPQTEIAQEIVSICQNIYERMPRIETASQDAILDKLVWTAFGF